MPERARYFGDTDDLGNGAVLVGPVTGMFCFDCPELRP